MKTESLVNPSTKSWAGMLKRLFRGFMDMQSLMIIKWMVASEKEEEAEEEEEEEMDGCEEEEVRPSFWRSLSASK